jgi:hypothetical protein
MRSQVILRRFEQFSFMRIESIYNVYVYLFLTFEDFVLCHVTFDLFILLFDVAYVNIITEKAIHSLCI